MKEDRAALDRIKIQQLEQRVQDLEALVIRLDRRVGVLAERLQALWDES